MIHTALATGLARAIRTRAYISAVTVQRLVHAIESLSNPFKNPRTPPRDAVLVPLHACKRIYAVSMSFLKGNVIDGKAVAQQCREDTAKEVAELEAKYGKVDSHNAYAQTFPSCIGVMLLRAPHCELLHSNHASQPMILTDLLLIDRFAGVPSFTGVSVSVVDIEPESESPKPLCS
jgi:hypothetical protein